MEPSEAFVAVTAIVAGCIMLALLFKYGAQVVRSIFGAPAVGTGGNAEASASLTQGEVEGMIRRAVREEVRQEVRPLREKIERLEEGAPQQQPRRDLPSGEFPEDPHDFGLIAGETDTREAQDVA